PSALAFRCSPLRLRRSGGLAGDRPYLGRAVPGLQADDLLLAGLRVALGLLHHADGEDVTHGNEDSRKLRGCDWLVLDFRCAQLVVPYAACRVDRVPARVKTMIIRLDRHVDTVTLGALVIPRVTADLLNPPLARAVHAEPVCREQARNRPDTSQHI